MDFNEDNIHAYLDVLVDLVVYFFLLIQHRIQDGIYEITQV